jgi:DNA-binding response OmpR family regulator
MSSPSHAQRPVLVIEDHDDTRDMVEAYLQAHGFTTIGAPHGLQGLAILRNHRPCLILLDLTMPVMDGWQFRQEQRRLADSDLAGIPVLILSAIDDVGRHARALGAADVIPKPIDFDRMLETVRAHCGDTSG